MRIIISPAKKMQEDTDYYSFHDYPVFLQKTEILLDWIKELSFSEQKRLWACNDIIARQNSPFRGKLIQTHFEPKVNPGKCCLGSSCDSIGNQEFPGL